MDKKVMGLKLVAPGAVWLTDIETGLVLRAHEEEPELDSIVPVEFFTEGKWLNQSGVEDQQLSQAFDSWTRTIGPSPADEALQTQWPETLLGQALRVFAMSQVELTTVPE